MASPVSEYLRSGDANSAFTIQAEEMVLAIHGWLRNVRYHAGLYLHWKRQGSARRNLRGGHDNGDEEPDETVDSPTKQHKAL